MCKSLFVITLLALCSCGERNANAQKNDTVQDTGKIVVYERDFSAATVFFDIEISGEINVFDKPHGKVIKTLQYDKNDENCIMFDLLEKNDSMYYVVAYTSMFGKLLAKGWIDKDNHLAIYSSIGVGNFVLYKVPHDKKNILAVEKEYTGDSYNVIDFDGQWLQIEAKINGKTYKGWIPPKEQCSNVYSTCN